MKAYLVKTSMMVTLLGLNMGMVSPVSAQNNDEAENYNFVFKGNSEGYKNYRIPAIVKTKKNTLIAFIEGRVNGIGDAGNIDLVSKRSTDGGKTWGPMITVHDDGNHTCGNPAPVVDPRNGYIYMISCGSTGSEHENLHNIKPREVYFQVSKDDGLTWSKPVNISKQAKKPEWGWFATGPCNAIIVREGKYKGRIVVPSNMSEMAEVEQNGEMVKKPVYRGSCFYSDDLGKTWKIGDTADDGANESSIAEVKPNLLVQNFRMQDHGQARRWQRYSEDGGKTWTKIEKQDDLYCPRCQGSIIRDYTQKETLYFSNPAKWGRNNMTIYRSKDGGKTWNDSILVHEGPASYSNIVDCSPEYIGILYEGGKNHASAEGTIFKLVKKADFKPVEKK